MTDKPYLEDIDADLLQQLKGIDFHAWANLSLTQVVGILRHQRACSTEYKSNDCILRSIYFDALKQRFEFGLQVGQHMHAVSRNGEVATTLWSDIERDSANAVHALEEKQKEELAANEEEESDEDNDSDASPQPKPMSQPRESTGSINDTKDENHSIYNPWTPYSTLLEEIPLVVSDNIDVAGYSTTCGCRVLETHRPVQHSAVAQTLVQCGASILGKGSVHGLMLGMTCNHTLKGPIRNPYTKHGISGGSAGGVASAVASRVATAGIAIDSIGDARVAASLCGVVGFRPTPSQISLRGIAKLSSTLDTVSVVARNIADVSLLYTILRSNMAFTIQRPVYVLSAPPIIKKKVDDDDDEDEEEEDEEDEEEMDTDRLLRLIRRKRGQIEEQPIHNAQHDRIMARLARAEQERKDRLGRVPQFPSKQESETQKALKTTFESHKMNHRNTDLLDRSNNENDANPIEQETKGEDTDLNKALDLIENATSSAKDVLYRLCSGSAIRSGADTRRPDILSSPSREIKRTPLSGVRIGLARKAFWSNTDPSVTREVDAFVSRLSSAGAELVYMDLPTIQLPKLLITAMSQWMDIPMEEEMNLVEASQIIAFIIRYWEAPRELQQYLAQAGLDEKHLPPIYTEEVYDKQGNVKPLLKKPASAQSIEAISLLKLIETSSCTKEEQQTLARQLNGDECLSSDVYITALANLRPRIIDLLKSYFAENSIDVMVYPSACVPAVATVSDKYFRTHGTQIECLNALSRNASIASVAGMPSVTIPCGLSKLRAGANPGEVGSERLPIGVELTTLPGTDDQLLSLAAKAERLQAPIADPILLLKWSAAIHSY